MLYAWGYTAQTPQPDEAVRLINVSGAPANIGGWQVRNEAGGVVTLPLTATIAAGQKLWIADTATGFRTYFGFNPDYEYGADTDPTVPQATATGGYTFADLGGAVQLLDNASALQDTLVYGTGNPSTPGWSGPALPYYTNPSSQVTTGLGQIFYRKLNELTARPVPDTNSGNDWAQDRNNDSYNDNIDGKKLLRPAWALTDPANEDMFFTKVYTDSNVTTKFLVAPDNTFDAVDNAIISATQSITIETYEWHAVPLVNDIIAAKNRGVRVSIALEGNPCCASPPRPDDETLWSAQQFENAGIPVYFFSGDPNTPDNQYRYNNVHAKFMIVDDTWVVTGAENFSLTSMPNDPKGNGTMGHRGSMIITNAPDVVTYFKRLRDFDFAPGRYPDLVRWNTAPGFGTPVATPTALGDLTGYTLIKPTPLVVTENERIEVIQSPDNDLRDQDGLIGLVNTAGAGDEVLVEQQYERLYWDTSVAVGPNPRLQAYIAAAQRGANVQIILDAHFDDCGSTHNSATVAYVDSFALCNLQARIADPALNEIHNKLVLVRHGAVYTVHSTSINGSENSAKNNREVGLQIQSAPAYQYYKDVFNYDWSVGYTSTCFPGTPTPVPCAAGTATPTVTGTPPTATITNTPTPTQPPATVTPIPSTCNYLVNGGFESGSLAPWATTTPGITAVVVTDPVNTGTFAVAVTSVFTSGNGGSQGIQQDMGNIVAGATYRVGAAVLRRATNIQSARIRVTWYPCATAGTCGGTNNSPDIFLGNNGPNWQYASGNMTAIPGTLSARFKLVFYTSDGNPATIYFDDAVFDCNGNGTATPTNTNTPLPPTLTPTDIPTSTNTQAPSTDTPTPTPTCTLSPDYLFTTTNSGATEVPAPNYVSGSTCNSCTVNIPLPFAYSLYDIPYTSVNASNEGNLQFTTNNPISSNSCLPAASLGDAIIPYWDDINSNINDIMGVYTSVTGVAPNRIFNIRWYGGYEGNDALVDMEARLYEGQPKFEIIYANVTRIGYSATIGVQKGDGSRFTQFECNTGNTVQNGMRVVYDRRVCQNGVSGKAQGPGSGAPQDLTQQEPKMQSPDCYTAGASKFSDVDKGSALANTVQCLVCRGIVSGYPDGTFRPTGTLSRGELAKMVSNAAGFTEKIDYQAFQDVSPADPFYVYLNRLYIRGYISGYACGGAGEPCIGGDAVGGNKPYFRPAAEATRAQEAVLVARVARLGKQSGQGQQGQLFEDVAPTDPFYAEIQELAARNIITGYPCGGVGPASGSGSGAGEPCDAQKRPYYRPNSVVTRGQTAKIVGDVFFPDCNLPVRR